MRARGPNAVAAKLAKSAAAKAPIEKAKPEKKKFSPDATRPDPQVLYSAMDVARYCDVDPKTIHNWTLRGKIAHAKTSGGHLRFRRIDVVEFLHAYGYSIPPDLGVAKWRVAIVHANPAVLTAALRALSRRFEVAIFGDPFDALLTLPAFDPDAFVLDSSSGAIDVARCVQRLRAHAATRHVRVVVLAEDTTRSLLMAAGARDVVPRADVEALGESLEAVLPHAAARRLRRAVYA